MHGEFGEDDLLEQRGLRAKAAGLGTAAARRANTAERHFLSLLRYSALVAATIALVVAIILLGLGLVRQIGKTEVEPAKVSVAASDVVPQNDKEENVSEPEAQRPSIPKSIRQKTAAIYRADFAKHERSDAKITEEQVVDLVWPEEMIKLFEELGDAGLRDGQGQLLVGKGAVMLDALQTVSAATKDKNYVKQLVGYHDAKKVNVCTNETRTKRRTVEAWDSYSTSCNYWWESPVGCSTTRVISEPYTQKVCEMKFPDDLQAPAKLFAESILQYADAAQMGLEKASLDASIETAENHSRKLNGQGNIGLSGKLFLGFLAVMFLYLFVAMERHNRNLRALKSRDVD